ncbi:MAG TPA: hypothetical protein DCR65_02665 [Gammaproteobacteria bacterium]|jgi:hypothetical protein|nr:hypothetical protein [Gammaproteobacteria bacterium]
MLRTLLLVPLVIVAAATSASVSAADTYGVKFSATFRPTLGLVDASMTVSQAEGELEWLDMNAPEGRTFEFTGDGRVRRDGNRVRWDVPPDGGQLRWRVRVDRLRGDRYDARMTTDWALLRIDHLFPAAHVSTRERERSRSTLELQGPAGWAFETRYGRIEEAVALPGSERRFVRPTGWMMAGKLGVRRDTIAGRKVVVAGPRGERLRSQDILALLRWTLPELVTLLPHFPDRLLIVNAGDPMWRGGLSGPGSLYLHSARPLISADGSSTPVHELVHVGTSSEANPGNDWIVEGLAEFYSIELLRRSGTVGAWRARRTFASFEARARRGKGELRSPSSGAHTARAVTVFHDLDRELRRAKVPHGLDAVATPLLDGPPLSKAALEERVTKLLGRPSAVLENAYARYLKTR